MTILQDKQLVCKGTTKKKAHSKVTGIHFTNSRNFTNNVLLPAFILHAKLYKNGSKNLKSQPTS
jgi:hypothetical protein